MKFLFAFLLCLSCAWRAEAGAVPTYELPELAAAADIIVVAHSGESQKLGLEKTATGTFNGDGQPNFVEAQLKQVSLQTVLPIRGELAEGATLIFPAVYRTQMGANVLPDSVFPQVKENADLLLFLQKSANNQYRLVYPLNYYGSVIELSEATLKQPRIEGYPLREILLLLADELSQSQGTRAINLMRKISQSGFLLYMSWELTPETSWMRHRDSTSEFRRGVGETEPGYEAWISANITPKILALTADDDPAVSQQAVLTAAALQDVSVLRQLLELAEKEDPKQPRGFANALRDYKTPAAISLLIPAALSPNDRVRNSAAFALRSMDEPALVPLFLRLLDDTDEDNLISALIGLSEALPDVEVPHGEGRGLQDAVLFWKNWARDNADKVNELSQEMTEKYQIKF